MMDADERFRLAVSAHTACEFALGVTDWSYEDPPEAMRCLVGQLLLDELEYNEDWRTAAALRRSLHRRYPEFFARAT